MSHVFFRMQWTAEASVFGAVSLVFFVCVWNIWGGENHWTICAIFTRKITSLKVKGRQRSKSPGTTTTFFGPFGGLCAIYASLASSSTFSFYFCHVFTFLAFYSIIMAALCNRGGHYIFALWFLSSSFFLFSSPNLSGRRSDAYHTSTHGVALVRI